jgi:hypothetical protein
LFCGQVGPAVGPWLPTRTLPTIEFPRCLPLAQLSFAQYASATCAEDVRERAAGQIGFNLAYIGSDFTKELPNPFDQTFMRALFDYGYQRARRGYEWAHEPPTV